MTYQPIPGVPPSRNPSHRRYRSPEHIAATRLITRQRIPRLPLTHSLGRLPHRARTLRVLIPDSVREHFPLPIVTK